MKALNLRNVRKLSVQRFDQGVFDRELAVRGLPQLLNCF